jgi:hypothetical protein
MLAAVRTREEMAVERGFWWNGGKLKVSKGENRRPARQRQESVASARFLEGQLLDLWCQSTAARCDPHRARCRRCPVGRAVIALG